MICSCPLQVVRALMTAVSVLCWAQKPGCNSCVLFFLGKTLFQNVTKKKNVKNCKKKKKSISFVSPLGIHFMRRRAHVTSRDMLVMLDAIYNGRQQRRHCSWENSSERQTQKFKKEHFNYYEKLSKVAREWYFKKMYLVYGLDPCEPTYWSRPAVVS